VLLGTYKGFFCEKEAKQSGTTVMFVTVPASSLEGAGLFCCFHGKFRVNKAIQIKRRK